MHRIRKLHRLMFECFDDMYMGKAEKILLQNIHNFREIIKNIINEKRTDMLEDSSE
jgi:hypothetical protein